MPFDATVTSVHRMTPKVKQFVLEADDEFEFEPGQHTTVRFDPADSEAVGSDDDGNGDDQVVRPYTATNLPGTDTITLAIKRYDEGTASVWMHERTPGDTVRLGDLGGNLTLRDPGADVVFVSTGTGITPMMALLKQYLEEGTGEAHFFYGEKTQESVLYRETLDQFEAANETLSVVYSLSDEEWDGPTGHVQEQLGNRLEDLDGKHYYVCGVPEMVVDTKERLDDLGVPDDQVFSEGWEEGEVEE